MINLKKKSWNDVSITDWKKLRDISEENISEAEKNVATLAVLCEVSEDELWDMPVGELQRLQNGIDWIGKFDFNKKASHKRITIGGEKYNITTDLNKLTVAAYVDYQLYINDRDNHMGDILACFIVPEGKTYGNGYDVQELAKKIEDTVSIVFWNEIFFSLLRNSLYSIKAMQIYLTYRQKKTKDKKEREMMEEAMTKLKEMMDTLG